MPKVTDRNMSFAMVHGGQLLNGKIEWKKFLKSFLLLTIDYCIHIQNFLCMRGFCKHL